MKVRVRYIGVDSEHTFKEYDLTDPLESNRYGLDIAGTVLKGDIAIICKHPLTHMLMIKSIMSACGCDTIDEQDTSLVVRDPSDCQTQFYFNNDQLTEIM